MIIGARFEPTFRPVIIGIIVCHMSPGFKRLEIGISHTCFYRELCTRGPLEAVYRLVETHTLVALSNKASHGPRWYTSNYRRVYCISSGASTVCNSNRVASDPIALGISYQIVTEGWVPSMRNRFCEAHEKSLYSIRLITSQSAMS